MRGKGKKLVSLLLSVVLLLGLLPGQAQAATASSLAYVITVGEIHQDEAREVLVKVNQERAKQGIQPVKMIDELEGLAVQRAVEQLANFDHVRPDGTPWNTVWEEAGLTIYGGISENIAFGYNNATEVMAGWMASTMGHRENILNSQWAYVGIGCFEYEGVKYWAQFFAEDLDEQNNTPADPTGITGEYPAAYWLDTDFLQQEAEEPKKLSMRFVESKSILDVNDPEYQSAMFDLGIFEQVGRGERLLGVVFTASLDETNLTIPKDAPFTVTDENEIVPKKDGVSGTYRLTAHIGNLTANKDIEVRFACKHPAASQTTSRVNPTCTTEGSETVTCNDCGVVVSVKTLDKVPHNMGEWKVITAATCTSKGMKERSCVTCNGEKETQEIAALGHEPKTMVKKDATCTDAGEKVTTCGRCSIELKKETIPAKGHTWSDWRTTIQPTWDAKGEEERTCSVCSVKEKNELPSLSTSHEHSFKGEGVVTKEATCTETGTREISCDEPKCDEKLVRVIEAKGHDEGTWTTKEEPSCAKAGLAIRQCNVCEETLETKTLHKIAHIWDAGKVTKEAGCTEEGIKLYTCHVCKEEREEAIAALGHKQGNWVVLTEPTCTKEGIKILSCTVCGEQLEKAYLEAYGHTEGDWETTEGNCTEGGFRIKHCIVCNVEIARENLPATGHMWSEWKVESKASVLSEGRKSRTCSVCQEKEEIVDPRKEIDYTTNTNYGLANFTIVDAVTLKPVPGACVLISTEAEGDGLLYADKDGILSQVVPTGIVNISVYTDNYNVRNISVTIYPGENDIPAIGISRNNLVDGKLTSSEMTYEEMIEAGIDVGSSGNHHVYKYELKLEFEAQIDYLSLFYYMNPQTGKLNVYRPSDDNEGDSGESSGSGKGYRAELIIDPFAGVDEGKGVGTKYTFDDGQVVSVYPISEVFYLVIRGEVGWVKEMYDVELMAINNSMTDTVSNAVAELMLPEGLSLATMKGEQQTLLQYIGELAHGESKSIHWYVRGDEEGSYSITAKLSGKMLPFGDSFEYTYTTASPIHVYAGSAMHLRFYVPDAAFTGEDYTIRMELENVSNKILYHVSHRIMDIEQYRITYYSNETQEIEDYPVPSTGGMAISIDKFYPGDKLIMEVPIEIFFESELIQAQMDNLLKSMRQFQNLYNNYKAVATGLNLLMDLIDFISGASANLDNYVGSLTDNSVELKRSCIKLLDEFSKLLSKCTDSSNSEVLEAISKLKSGTLNGETNLWDVLQNISDNPAVLNMMTAAKIADIASRLKATVDGIDSKKESFGAYEAMEKAMELIPIRYVLKSSSITTLQNSSTEIPTSVVVTPTGERFFGVESVGDYLYNSIIVSFGENIETESFIKNWGFDVKKIMGYEEAVEYLKIANEKAAHILASDNTSKGTFKAWYEPTVRAYSLTSNSSYELTVDNENAQWKEGKLTFTGPGMISLVPHNETGGTLYVEDPEGNVKAFEIEVVEAHTCASDEWDVLVAPSDETDGVKAKCCSICDDVIAIESMASCSKHKYGEYESDMTATLEASGIQVHTCVNCGAMEYRYTDAYSRNGYIYCFQSGTTVEEILDFFKEKGMDVTMEDLSPWDLAATGYTLEYEGMPYQIVISGDVDGDAEISIFDLLGVIDHIDFS